MQLVSATLQHRQVGAHSVPLGMHVGQCRSIVGLGPTGNLASSDNVSESSPHFARHDVRQGYVPKSFAGTQQCFGPSVNHDSVRVDFSYRVEVNAVEYNAIVGFVGYNEDWTIRAAFVDLVQHIRKLLQCFHGINLTRRVVGAVNENEARRIRDGPPDGRHVQIKVLCGRYHDRLDPHQFELLPVDEINRRHENGRFARVRQNRHGQRQSREGAVGRKDVLRIHRETAALLEVPNDGFLDFGDLHAVRKSVRVLRSADHSSHGFRQRRQGLLLRLTETQVAIAAKALRLFLPVIDEGEERVPRRKGRSFTEH
mmetsp:Transcript_2517/g.4461  ORF Transcript_2517/g.4461 Transcript_2517/m.4461 type:complete len:312 (-) Transcript_2517:56-991(-)